MPRRSKAKAGRINRHTEDTAQQASLDKRGFREFTMWSPMGFFYVYILQSKTHPEHFYTGLTEDLQARLKKHNGGEVKATIAFRPWRIKTAIAFTDHQGATQFERYLKTASGRAFAKKRL